MTLCDLTHVKWCVCQFDDKVKESLLTEAQTLLDAINNPSMKEVKGLEDRLYGLEQLMFGAKKIVQEQGEMAQVGGLRGRGWGGGGDGAWEGGNMGYWWVGI